MFTFLVTTTLLAIVSANEWTFTGGQVCEQLIAGQHYDAGDVCFEYNSGQVCVEYLTNQGWTMDNVHLWMGTDTNTIPTTGGGGYQLGNFPYTQTFNPAVEHYQVCEDITNLGISAQCSPEDTETIYAVAHTTVGGPYGGQTAYGGSWKGIMDLTLECETDAPTVSPTRNPTRSPTKNPTASPTKNPTRSPTRNPTKNPTENPTRSPTKNPTNNPTRSPTKNPTENPTVSPTRSPTKNPTRSPTRNPTKNPTENPTVSPTRSPTKNPTRSPTRNPTKNPTRSPTRSPTKNPTENPTVSPTRSPTKNPTENPTRSPTRSPTKNPTENPTVSPTRSPTKNPTKNPTENPTRSPTRSPTKNPTENPTRSPTRSPTKNPTENPTRSPTRNPTKNPTKSPTPFPTPEPTDHPTKNPTRSPTNSPTEPQCETAWAYDPQKGTCFLDLDMKKSDAWGWSNGLYNDETAKLELWAGAAHCDTSKGMLVGDVYVNSLQSINKMYIYVFTTNPFYMTNSQTYVGVEYLPKRGNSYISSPGRFPYKKVINGNYVDYEIHIDDNPVYVAVHVDVCGF